MTEKQSKPGRKCDDCGALFGNSPMISVSNRLYCPDCYNKKLKEAVNGFSSNNENPVLHFEFGKDAIDISRCSQGNDSDVSCEKIVRLEKVNDGMDSDKKMDTAITTCCAVSCRWNEQNICRFRSVAIGEDGRCKEFEVR